MMFRTYVVGQAFSVLQVSRCVWQVLVPAVHRQGHVIVVRPERAKTQTLNYVWILYANNTSHAPSFRTGHAPLLLLCLYRASFWYKDQQYEGWMKCMVNIVTVMLFLMNITWHLILMPRCTKFFFFDKLNLKNWHKIRVFLPVRYKSQATKRRSKTILKSNKLRKSGKLFPRHRYH